MHASASPPRFQRIVVGPITLVYRANYARLSGSSRTLPAFLAADARATRRTPQQEGTQPHIHASGAVTEAANASGSGRGRSSGIRARVPNQTFLWQPTCVEGPIEWPQL